MLPVPRQAQFSYAYNYNNNNNNNNNLLKPHFELTPEIKVYGTVAYYGEIFYKLLLNLGKCKTFQNTRITLSD